MLMELETMKMPSASNSNLPPMQPHWRWSHQTVSAKPSVVQVGLSVKGEGMMCRCVLEEAMTILRVM